MYYIVIWSFLLHTFVLGSPTHSVYTSLTALEKSCGNPYLSKNINNKLEECNVSAPPYKLQQTKCLLFTDINKQLCTAFKDSSILKEDPMSKVNEVQDLKKLCESARAWNASDIADFPDYKTYAEKIFKNEFLCVRVCGSEVLNDDTNFYCKYYALGVSLLSNLSNIPSNQINLVDDSNDILARTISENNINMEKLKTAPGTIVSNPSESDVNAEINQNANLPVIEKTTTVLNPIVTKAQESADKVIQVNENNSAQKVEQPSVKIGVPASVENDNGAINKINEDVPASAKIENSDINLLHENKVPVIENPEPKPNNDMDDYQAREIDSEDGKDGLPETQDGDDGDGDDPVLGELDTKNDQLRDKSILNKIESPLSFSRDISQREYMSKAMPDVALEGDDNFFPFFLTAIAMVVLLYILYHNKNRISKTVLGLIVEGRQSGRRRNSRGHAYRRLDTLEQAMSTNASAPPSKIIY